MYMDLTQGKHFLVLLTILMHSTVSTWKAKKTVSNFNLVLQNFSLDQYYS